MKRILIFAVVIFLCSGVFGISGVNPVSYDVDFEPGLEKEFVFDFVFDGNANVDLYIEGELAECVTLDKSRIKGREDVVASLTLPFNLDVYGISSVMVVATDGISETKGILKVRIPYPEEYIEPELSISSVNFGEVVDFTFTLFNRGVIDTEAVSVVQIFKDGEEIETFDFALEKIDARSSISHGVSFDTSGYSPGDYVVIVFSDYGEGKFALSESSFRVGEFYVGVLDYSNELKQGGIERFQVDVESFWNKRINDFYMGVSILNSDASFVTPTEVLGPWETISIGGFLDTSSITGENVEAEIVLHYGDEVTSRVVLLRGVPGFNYFNLIYVLLGVVLLGVLVWRIFIFTRKPKKKK